MIGSFCPFVESKTHENVYCLHVSVGKGVHWMSAFWMQLQHSTVGG